MPFPLHHRPGGVLFLDDDADYLEMVGRVMPQQWYVRLLLRPVECIELLLGERPLRESDAWRQQEIVNRWREGASLIAGILRYWHDDGSARFALTQVCVVDYAMPAMSGLRVLSELTDWTGSRVLLTGRVEEQLAVSAFNRGLIERFIPKQSASIGTTLTQTIQELFDLADSRHEQIWRTSLSREQSELLRLPQVQRELADLAKKQAWVEHIVIGVPFGVLALDRVGQVSWLQLEPEANLPDLAEMAESQGWDAATVGDIRRGQQLVDLELRHAFGGGYRAESRPAFSLGGEASRLRACLVRLDAACLPGPIASHDGFIAAGGERRLQD